MDSWDFSASVHSPTTSIYRRSVLSRMVSEEEEKELRASGIFPVDEDDDDDEHPPVHQRADPEPCVPSISPATSESSVYTRASSAPTTAPSSYVEQPDSGWQFPQAADVLKPIPEVVRSPDRTVQDDEKNGLLTPKTVRGHRERLASSSSATSVSSSTPSLWKKLKGIRRPGSRGSVESDATPAKDKTKGLFESTSRGILSQTSSTTKLKSSRAYFPSLYRILSDQRFSVNQALHLTARLLANSLIVNRPVPGLDPLATCFATICIPTSCHVSCTSYDSHVLISCIIVVLICFSYSSMLFCFLGDGESIVEIR